MYAHAQAPVRIGIAGGGTDLPAWTKERVGLCLSLAIKTYTHAVAISRPDGRVVASYSRRDEAEAATEIANGLVRESALMHGFEDSFEVHILSEISSRGSGLGVSSSIAVSLAACFRKLHMLRSSTNMVSFGDDAQFFAKGPDPVTQGLANNAWTVEIDRLRRPIGRQDHMAAAHGGLRLYAFEGDTARVERTFTEENARWVAQHLAIVELPGGHDSRRILAGVHDTSQLGLAREAVDVAVAAIESRDPVALGRAIGLGQQSKSRIAGAVTPEIAALVKRLGELPGIYGCKVAGAGGGGHLIVAGDFDKVDIRGAVGVLPVRGVEPDLVGVRSEGWR